jgi:hypothetical protein
MNIEVFCLILLFLFVFGLAINAYEEGNYPIKLPEPNNMLTEEE